VHNGGSRLESETHAMRQHQKEEKKLSTAIQEVLAIRQLMGCCKRPHWKTALKMLQLQERLSILI